MRPAIAIFCLIVAGVALVAILSLKGPHPDPLPNDAGQTEDAAKPPTPAENVNAEEQFAKVRTGAVRASLEIKDRGIIEMELYPQAAPKTVAHLTDLSKKKFWDNLKVHREEPIVVQMGDPESKDVKVEDFKLKGIGGHGSGTTVPLEVSAKLPNVRYSVGLARAQDPDSGDSQFYINKQDNAGFNFQYCVFGRIIKGNELVDQIKQGDVIKHFIISDATK